MVDQRLRLRLLLLLLPLILLVVRVQDSFRERELLAGESCTVDCAIGFEGASATYQCHLETSRFRVWFSLGIKADGQGSMGYEQGSRGYKRVGPSRADRNLKEI